MKKVPRFRLHEEDDISLSRIRKKAIEMERRRETEHGGFDCSHCSEWASINDSIGTHNRNHCPHCLWSKHLDNDKLGDRKSTCKSGMEPIALTFKQEGSDRYGVQKLRIGELMLVHECVSDDLVRINRIAADDNPEQLLSVFEKGYSVATSVIGRLASEGIIIARIESEAEVRQQLYGIRNLE